MHAQSTLSPSPIRGATLAAALALLLASPAFAQTTNTFTYNSAEQLTQVRETAPMQLTLATSTYDGDGERVTKTEGVTTVIYVRDPSGNVLAEYNAGTGALIADYVYFNGRKVCRVAADGSRRYFHHDPLGTPRAVTDAAGSVLWRGEHKAFGETYTSNPAGGDHYTFTGHEWEDESSLLYLHARYYDPSIGRFLSTDPVGGKLDNPQTWNRYAYALNNPLRYVDPDGAWVLPWEALDAYSYAQSSRAWSAAWTRFTHNPGWRTGFEAGVNLGYATIDAAGLLLPAVPAVAGLSARATEAVAPTVARVLGRADRATDAARGQTHHVMTNKNWVSSLRGGPWSPRFSDIAQKAGMTLDDVANKVDVPGHVGPHPEAYHQAVLDRLTAATNGLSGDAYSAAFRAELGAIGTEAAMAGTHLNDLLTGF